MAEVIDLSENGNQPMQDQNGNTIIFNGEIYNHDQLRTQMINENGEMQIGMTIHIIMVFSVR